MTFLVEFLVLLGIMGNVMIIGLSYELDMFDDVMWVGFGVEIASMMFK